MTICTNKQRMTVQRLRKSLGLSLLSKTKLDTMSTAVCSQLIEDYLKLLRMRDEKKEEDYVSHTYAYTGKPDEA